MKPSVCGTTLTPSSAGLSSSAAGSLGTWSPKSDVGPVRSTVRVTAAPRFALSSVARALMVAEPSPVTAPLYVQVAVPVAGCQLTPPSSETSMPATTPPPASVAVPETVTTVPAPIEALAPGEVITVVGATVSVEAVAASSPLISVAGCACMSASRFTVACCMGLFAGSFGMYWLSCQSSRPQAYWMVPAPNTSAPLAAR
jgi:hypothetical protein